jgi:hypothetical protein
MAEQKKAAPVKASAKDTGNDAAQDAAEVQANVDVETEQGFRGVEVDPTPNENYTLAGQNAGAPVPETDEATAKVAVDARDDVAKQANGVSER